MKEVHGSRLLFSSRLVMWCISLGSGRISRGDKKLIDIPWHRKASSCIMNRFNIFCKSYLNVHSYIQYKYPWFSQQWTALAMPPRRNKMTAVCILSWGEGDNPTQVLLTEWSISSWCCWTVGIQIMDNNTWLTMTDIVSYVSIKV